MKFKGKRTNMKYPLTIFTPTYNRGHLLPILFDSLCKQARKDFEWIIIDDESTDNTSEIVQSFIKSPNDFNIRYFVQNHGGKHRALNKAFNLAEGEFFLIVDSDDYLTTDAVMKILNWIEQVRDNGKIAGIAGLRVTSQNEVIGKTPKFKNRNWMDASNFERDKYGLLGDKAEIYRTDILKEHFFPEFHGEYFVTEAVCWDAIAAQGYKIRWFNEPIYVCEYLEDGLTKNGANELNGHLENYHGYCFYIEQSLKIKPALQVVFDFLEYQKTTKYMGKNIKESANDIHVKYKKYLWNMYIKIPVLYCCKLFLNLKNKLLDIVFS